MMATPVHVPPAARLQALADAYAAGARRQKLQFLLAAAVLLCCALASAWVAQFDALLLWRKLGGFFGYFDRLLTLEGGSLAGQRVWMDPMEWFWGLPHWLLLLADTVLMAALGTLVGFAGGLALAFVAAANMGCPAWLRFAVRRLLEFCRTVPEMVFALIFVIAFGLGPLPGVLAIAIHCIGALGKQFSEVVENIDPRPVEGATAAGASWVEVVAFAALPQVLSNVASYTLLRFEINLRGAAVLGFVGAGGIGQDLIEAIRKFYYNDVAALLVLIILAVTVLDLLTGRLRARLQGGMA